MLQLCLDRPIDLVMFGEFISPEHGWRHLTRTLCEYELFLVTQGTLYISDGTTEFQVPQGNFLLMPPTPNQHGTRECVCRFFWLHFSCANECKTPNFDFPRTGHIRDYDFIRNLFERFALAEDGECNGLHSRYLATQILLELRRQEREYRRTQGLLSSNEKLRLEIEEYAARRGYGNIRVSEIARALGYAEKYLSCVYKKTAEMPLKTFLKQKRAEQAKRLLRSTDYSVTEIAYFLNFDNPHNFCRFFKDVAGVTPSEYRLSYSSRSNLSNSAVQPSTTSE